MRFLRFCVFAIFVILAAWGLCMTEMPLFVKVHDWNLWLLQRTQRFPRSLRHSYTDRLEKLAFDFEELILRANSARGRQRREWLEAADSVLSRQRALLRYAGDLQLLAVNQLRYASEQLDQLGRLLGAWLKGTDR